MVIEAYIENIKIDKSFQRKIISPKVHEELYEELNMLISYIDSEISKLTSENDKAISEGFMKINAIAELDGKAIEYLGGKYK